MHRSYRQRLAVYPYIAVCVQCEDCDLYECFRLTRLVADYGCDISMADLLQALMRHCHRFDVATMGADRPCAACFPDLSSEERPDFPPERPKLKVVK